MRAFALKIKRPFAVRYNPYNQSIEILSNAEQVTNIVSDLKGDICIIFDALKKLEEAMPGNKGLNAEDEERLKKIRRYKKLESAFKEMSLDIS
jgi:hypothetical protein